MGDEQFAVEIFHRKFRRAIGVRIGDNWHDVKQRRLRAALIFEEACEFVAACGFDPREFFNDVQPALAEQRGAVGTVKVPTTEHDFDPRDGVCRRCSLDRLSTPSACIPKPDFPEAVDALCDLLYVTYGGGVTFGVPLSIPFNIVHESNMAKVGGGESEAGKILKPPGWTPPDIEGFLRRFGWKP